MTEAVIEVAVPAATRTRRFWHRTSSTRLRLLRWYLALTILALIAGLFVQRSILLAQVDNEVQAQLLQEVEELRQLSGGRDPATGTPFAGNVRAIFDTFLRRNLPVEGEALFTIVDGQPYASTTTPLQLLEDPALVARWSRVETPQQEDISTRAGPARYIAVPLFDGERVAGVFVVVFFMEARHAHIDNVIRTGVLVYGSVVLLASVVAWLTAGQVLKPIGELTAAAQSISESHWTDRIDVEGDDEIARLALTFNQMLDRLEAAFEAQRRLVDDAGHELRTPITIIRGHLELLSNEPRERAAAMRLVMDELDRMTRIVNDLLLLAKSEQPDFLHLQPVDLDELTSDIAAKASALDSRPWLLEERAVAVALADRQRLTQAMMNLCRNAAEHSPPGAPVTLGSCVEGDWFSLWVADEGAGIPLAERDRIFERFSRGVAGQRNAEGAGLGLAIVAAIVEAHGGHVVLDSQAGRGSRFTIVIPLEPQRES